MKMENQSTKIIKQLSTRLHTCEDDMWELYFESGCEYLERLCQRIIHFSIFKAQFGAMLNNGLLNITPNETFIRIQNSPEYWEWWATNLWGVCATSKPTTKSGLRFAASKTTDLIPVNTLTKIFTNDKFRTQQTKHLKSKSIKKRIEVEVSHV